MDQRSALAGYTCGTLAGHLIRSLLTVDTYLDDPVEPAAEPLHAAAYFHLALGDDDPGHLDQPASVHERRAELAGASATELRTPQARSRPVARTASAQPRGRASV